MAKLPAYGHYLLAAGDILEGQMNSCLTDMLLQVCEAASKTKEAPMARKRIGQREERESHEKSYGRIMRGQPAMNILQLAMHLGLSRESVRKTIIELQGTGLVALHEKRFEDHCCRGIHYYIWVGK